MMKFLGTVLKYGTLLSTVGLIGSVLIQIFARFFLANTPPWTEEASRLFFIYATAFGAGLALKQNYYVHLDLFFNGLPARVQSILLIMIPACTVILFGVMAAFSFRFIQLGHSEWSPSMKVRMSFVFFSMFIMGVSLSVYAFLDMLKAIDSFGRSSKGYKRQL